MTVRPVTVEFPALPTDASRALRSARRLYARMLRRCRTENELNRLHIRLENRLAPAELASICGGTPRRIRKLIARVVGRSVFLASKFPATGRHEWKLKMANRSAKSGKRTPEPYLRFRIAPYMDFYSTLGERATKTLIVCFKGRADRLLLPVPTFLQHLPAARYDILMLTDPFKRAYVQGLPSIPEGFPGLMQAIDSIVDRSRYRSVVSFGTSAGGLPALVLATRLGLDKGVSVCGGGGTPETPLSADLVHLLAGRRGESVIPNLLAIYGLDSERDQRAAESLAHIAGLRTLGVSSKTRRIGHNPLAAALVDARLGTFLECALDPLVKGFSDGSGSHTDTCEL